MNFRKTDYENYDYRKFWENNKRLYEDKAERIALRTLMAGVDKKDRIIFDIGCGYGRLFNEYMDFSTIVLIDSSVNNLKNARNRIEKFLCGNPGKISSVYFIASDASCLPVKSNCADTVLTVRVVHHLDNPRGYFDEVARILRNGGLYFLEFANKRNLKNIFRFIGGRMDTSPFNAKPSQVGETILNFHPRYIYNLLKERRFSVKKVISVSNFRINFLKKFPGTKTLIFFEKIYQRISSFITLGPSVFLKCILNKPADREINKVNKKIEIEDILICAFCKKAVLMFSENKIKCSNCGATFFKENGIYDFKANTLTDKKEISPE